MHAEANLRKSDNHCNDLSNAVHSRVGRFERLPKVLNLIPMVLQWVGLGLRYGSFTLPSAANPGITSGGLVGEGKTEYFAAMGAQGRAATATFIAIRNNPAMAQLELVQRLQCAGLEFPIVAKPDLGWCGHGVRLLRDADELFAYAHAFPTGEIFLLQRYLSEPGEAGIFYMREPGRERGELIGTLLRHYPAVVGDGRRTIADLVAANPRLRRCVTNPEHETTWDATQIPAKGERVRLSTVASTRVGGGYEDGSMLQTPALRDAIDAIAREMGVFLVGRFDVRFQSIDELQRGKFTIMEVNGAGSEAVHAWDPGYSIRQVYGIVFAKQRKLFAIAAANRALGHEPIGLLALARLFLRQNRLIACYPPSN